MKRVAIALVLSLLAAHASAAERMIRKEVTVGLPREEAWRKWATSDGIASFFAKKNKVELKVGGAFEMYFLDGAPLGQRGSEGCQILSYSPGETLAFSWNAPPQFPRVRKVRTQVVLAFQEAGPGRTKVTLTHLGWGEGEEWDKVYAYFDQAWPRVLEGFAKTYPAPKSAGRLYVYMIRPAREKLMETMTDAERGAIGRHFEYLKKLTSDGIVHIAGPCEDAAFGIVIFTAPDTDAARKIMEGDPAVQAKVFTSEVHPFVLALGKL